MSELLSYQFLVTERDAGERLDRFLVARRLPQTRSQIKRQIDGGACTINDRPAAPGKRLRSGDVILFTPQPPEPSSVQPEAIDLCVLHEDAQLIVVDKPPGMVVHPAPGHSRGTLVGALLAHCDDLSGVGGELRPGIVHRLDKLTSGVMVAAKTDAAHLHLSAQFAEHTIERRYLALVSGDPPDEGTFDTLHGRHPRDRKRFSTRVARGRRAVTHYRVVERLQGAALVEATLETGRTHQVRAHFADAGHQVLGDPQYGRAPADPRARSAGRELGRQALHARVLGLDDPSSGRRLRFVSPPPPDILEAIAALGGRTTGHRPQQSGHGDGGAES